MKNFKKIAAICCMVIMAISFNSCVESLHEEAYNFGISQFSGNTTAIFGYLESKYVPLTSITFKGSTQKDCDQQAIAKFNEFCTKLSYEEIANLGLSSNTSFTYSVSRGGVTIAAWKYPKQ